MVTKSYKRNHERKPAIVYKPIITAIRDVPAFLAASGPSPLLQRSSLQQELHIFVRLDPCNRQYSLLLWSILA